MLSKIDGLKIGNAKMGKTSNAKWTTPIILIALLFAQSNIVIAQSEKNQSIPINEPNMQNQASNKWGPPYPFTPDEIQEKLMQVLRLPAEELSRERVEAIFGMKMVNSDKLVPEELNEDSKHPEKNTKWYRVYSQANVDWYFSVVTAVVPSYTFFSFRWWNLSKTTYPIIIPMCVDLQKLSEAVENTNMGWKLLPARVDHPLREYVDSSLYFTRSVNASDSVKVEVLTGSKCMAAIEYRVTTNKGN